MNERCPPVVLYFAVKTKQQKNEGGRQSEQRKNPKYESMSQEELKANIPEKSRW